MLEFVQENPERTSPKLSAITESIHSTRVQALNSCRVNPLADCSNRIEREQKIALGLKSTFMPYSNTNIDNEVVNIT